jgi:tetratricopeptide (TPR) repeat protein
VSARSLVSGELTDSGVFTSAKSLLSGSVDMIRLESDIVSLKSERAEFELKTLNKNGSYNSDGATEDSFSESDRSFEIYPDVALLDHEYTACKSSSLLKSGDNAVTCTPTNSSSPSSACSSSFLKVSFSKALSMFSIGEYFTGKPEPANPQEQPRPTLTLQQQEQLSYWSELVDSCTSAFGTNHRKTAEALLHLGKTCMQCCDLKEALCAFNSACQIFKELDGPSSLSWAHAMDLVGEATLRLSHTEENLRHAKEALDEAFSVRFQLLGPWHVDTVESYNKMAAIYLHLSEFREACKAYEEIYLVRKAIFGADHPSVAIAAHALANVHFKLLEVEEARRYYKTALAIYSKMHLKSSRNLGRLTSDRERLERAIKKTACHI